MLSSDDEDSFNNNALSNNKTTNTKEDIEIKTASKSENNNSANKGKVNKGLSKKMEVDDYDDGQQKHNHSTSTQPINLNMNYENNHNKNNNKKKRNTMDVVKQLQINNHSFSGKSLLSSKPMNRGSRDRYHYSWKSADPLNQQQQRKSSKLNQIHKNKSLNKKSSKNQVELMDVACDDNAGDDDNEQNDVDIQGINRYNGLVEVGDQEIEVEGYDYFQKRMSTKKPVYINKQGIVQKVLIMDMKSFTNTGCICLIQNSQTCSVLEWVKASELIPCNWDSFTQWREQQSISM